MEKPGKDNNKGAKKINLIYIIKRYIQEFFEALIGIIVVILITKHKIPFSEVFRISFILGLVTLVLEEYNSEYSNVVKQGIFFTLGAAAFNVV